MRQDPDSAVDLAQLDTVEMEGGVKELSPATRDLASMECSVLTLKLDTDADIVLLDTPEMAQGMDARRRDRDVKRDHAFLEFSVMTQPMATGVIHAPLATLVMELEVAAEESHALTILATEEYLAGMMDVVGSVVEIALLD